ncbi:MAG: hypothetical protein K1000chlam2_01731, partial [Chlamydiae bacterium]|nr:hypothetical protein [Chlamydiota bacterium]
FNNFESIENTNIQIDKQPRAPREWAGRIVACLNAWDAEVDALLPNNLRIQDSMDRLANEIKEIFAPLAKFNHWLKESGNGDWYQRLAGSLILLPLRSASNVVSYLYSAISTILYTAVHPLNGLNHIAKSIVIVLDELTKPENWSKMGCGSIGALAGQTLILGNPLSLIGLGIGGAVIAAGISVDALDAAIRCERGKELEVIRDRLVLHVGQAPEALLTGLFTGMLIGGIRRATQGATKPMDIERKPTSHEYKKFENVAQFADGDWSGHIKTLHNMTLEEAKAFADQNDKVSFFFYMKSNLTYGNGTPNMNYFSSGDAVFFSGKPTWAYIHGKVDSYIKI